MLSQSILLIKSSSFFAVICHLIGPWLLCAKIPIFKKYKCMNYIFKKQFPVISFCRQNTIELEHESLCVTHTHTYTDIYSIYASVSRSNK